jgi:hypothetical protein
VTWASWDFSLGFTHGRIEDVADHSQKQAKLAEGLDIADGDLAVEELTRRAEKLDLLIDKQEEEGFGKGI